MNVTADSNVLIRLVVRDDAVQLRKAQTELAAAQIVCVSISTLCEIAWVLGRNYGHSRANIAAAIRAILASANVMANRAAADAGLAMLDVGGDFADGVIAFEGAALGGGTFASFDKTAVKLLTAQGVRAMLL
ncbi:MAG: PIN domain-containing protein [Pseudomonadota bacterium]